MRTTSRQVGLRRLFNDSCQSVVGIYCESDMLNVNQCPRNNPEREQMGNFFMLHLLEALYMLRSAEDLTLLCCLDIRKFQSSWRATNRVKGVFKEPKITCLHIYNPITLNLLDIHTLTLVLLILVSKHMDTSTW